MKHPSKIINEEGVTSSSDSVEMIYDMIYLTAIGQPLGGSCPVHIYTQTIQGTSQNKRYMEHKNT
jgi:hypothetical protein